MWWFVFCLDVIFQVITYIVCLEPWIRLLVAMWWFVFCPGVIFSNMTYIVCLELWVRLLLVIWWLVFCPRVTLVKDWAFKVKLLTNPSSISFTTRLTSAHCIASQALTLEKKLKKKNLWIGCGACLWCNDDNNRQARTPCECFPQIRHNTRLHFFPYPRGPFLCVAAKTLTN